MKKMLYITVAMLLGLALFSACATLHTWPDYERGAENKMIVIQENIGEGLSSSAFTPDMSQRFLTTLKGINTEYAEMKGKKVSQKNWDIIHKRLDVLGDDINRAFERAARIEEPKNGNRIVAFQRTIDDGIINGTVPLAEAKEFQIRLDTIRREYLRMTAEGKPPTYKERLVVAGELDSLAHDINSFRK